VGIRLKRIKGRLYILRTRPGRPARAEAQGPDTPEVRARAEALVAAAREELRADRALGADGLVPTLAAMAGKYLREDTARLAPTTRGDRPLYLRAGGALLGPLGPLRMDAITPAVLRGWWGEWIEGRSRTLATGRHYLDVLQAVYRYALDLELVESSPVPAYREILRRHARTKGGRATIEASVVRPLAGEEIGRLLASARVEGARDEVLVLLGLDAGLRLGEILGLRWGAVSPGDPGRHLHLDAESNRPRGIKRAEAPKSGRGRTVELSLRLRDALGALRRERMQPGPGELVARGVDPHNWRRREWRRICDRAGLGQRRIHDLRDTYASHLVSAGFPLAYVAEQLGHADMGTTARHYARWISRGRYVPPPVLEAGEVPADVLARAASGPLQGEAVTRQPSIRSSGRKVSR